MPVEPSAASAAARDSVWVGRISPRDGCCSGWVGAAVGGQVVGQPSCWPGPGQRQQLTFTAVSVERVPRPHSALPAACLAPGALEPHPGSSFVSVETLSPSRSLVRHPETSWVLWRCPEALLLLPPLSMDKLSLRLVVLTSRSAHAGD